MEDVEVLIQRMKEDIRKLQIIEEGRGLRKISNSPDTFSKKIEDGHLNGFRPGTTRRIEMRVW